MDFVVKLVNNSGHAISVVLPKSVVELAPYEAESSRVRNYTRDSMPIIVQSSAEKWNFAFAANLSGHNQRPVLNHYPEPAANIYQCLDPPERGAMHLTLSFGPAFSAKSWMGLLDYGPDAKLDDITMPGTHDTGTWLGNSNDQCQSEPLQTQLDIGVRWLDLRLGVNLDIMPFILSEYDQIPDDVKDLGIYHSGNWQKITLAKDILPVIKTFLENHPTETIVICVNRETGVLEHYENILSDLLLRVLGQDKLYQQPDIPRLADVQGKVVVMRRGEDLSFGIRTDNWPKDETGICGFGTNFLYVQDAFGYDIATSAEARIEAKWKNVETHLKAAAFGTVESVFHRPNAKAWYLNFTSASCAPNMVPVEFAEGVNPRLFRYLCSQTSPTRLGTVVMDFPDSFTSNYMDGLTKLLITMNKLKVPPG